MCCSGDGEEGEWRRSGGGMEEERRSGGGRVEEDRRRKRGGGVEEEHKEDIIGWSQAESPRARRTILYKGVRKPYTFIPI